MSGNTHPTDWEVIETADLKATAMEDHLAVLENLSSQELRQLWRRLYRATPPARIRRDLLMLGVSWKLQQQAARQRVRSGSRNPFKNKINNTTQIERGMERNGQEAAQQHDTSTELSPAMHRRLLAIASGEVDLDAGVLRSLKPGTVLLREWQGHTHRVTVLEQGFEWRGEHWASLSAIARTITGVHWSRPRFFGVNARSTRFSKKGTVDDHE